MTTPAGDIERAEAQGREAARHDVPFSANPYGPAVQGAPKRVLAIAWRRGYRQGELDQADSDGDLFRGTAR